MEEQSPNNSSHVTDLTTPVSWQAPEGVQVYRTAGWYVVMALVVVALMALAIFVFNSWTFALLVPIMAVALIVLRAKPLALINYSIGPKGVYVADTLHDFSEFRAFGLIKEGEQHSAILLPVKRFSPSLTIYFPEERGEAIVDMLGSRLPMQEISPDLVEKLVRAIRL